MLAAVLALGAGCGLTGGDSAVEPEDVVVTSSGSDVLERRTEQLPATPPATTAPQARTRATVPPARPEIRTYRAGEAGVVRVEVGQTLRLISFAPARGWEAKVTEEEPDEIEVSFYRGADEEIEFEVEIERGELRVEVDRED